jgi:hypothetical protein
MDLVLKSHPPHVIAFPKPISIGYVMDSVGQILPVRSPQPKILKNIFFIIGN